VALVVITGGARSGKSAAAEKLAASRAVLGASVVVAVFGRERTGDAEFAERVARHRADRPAAFATLEAADTATWRDAVAEESLLLVDCLGTLLGLAMEEAWDATHAVDAADELRATDPAAALAAAPADTLPPGFEAHCAAALDDAVRWLLAREGDTIVVTNEVGDGLVPAYATGRLFRDLLGRANRRLADSADAAYLAVAGRLIALDALPRSATWPRD
jgi:adenosyl cobinamide kinase/adenosyl cobinamide phosphate guanylyltransferase